VTFAFSTSSRLASVAVFDAGAVVWSGELDAPRNASSACMQLLRDCGIPVALGTRFCADIGPGSFTGVRVGVILAKTFGFTNRALVAGTDAFDLISVDGASAIPSRKGEWFVREPGSPPKRTSEVPGSIPGYGWPDDRPQHYPRAAAFLPLLERIVWQDPAAFRPDYLIEPSISTPNHPLSRVGGG